MRQNISKNKLKSYIRLGLVAIGVLAILTATLLNSSPRSVSALQGDLSSAVAKYPNIASSSLNQCSLCHLTAPALNPYGTAYLTAGRNTAAFAAIESLDSDNDGFNNLQEITDLKFPGDSASFPATATPTTPAPATATTQAPATATTQAPATATTQAPATATTQAPATATSGTVGTLLNFANICQASWSSGAGALPCPGTDGDARGFVLPVSNPKLEDGTLDTAPGLILFPQNKYDGYIQGTYPEITVQSGDRFQGIVNCAYSFPCYVTFRLDYQVGTGPVTTFWTWKEKNEGKYYRFDKDLSSLAGKNVKFILKILSTGPTTGDRALWGQPRIFRAGANTTPATPTPTTVTPVITFTPSRTPTPTPTGFTPPPATTGTALDFANICQAAWSNSAGALPCPGTDGDARGFVLPVSNPKLEDGTLDTAPGFILFPQNKYDGYIQGTYPEFTVQSGDRFQGIVNCAYGSSCYVTFRLEYQVGSGPITTFWSWMEKNEGKSYHFDKDLSSLAGKNVKFTLKLLSTGPTTGDRALWGQPRIFRAGANTTPATPIPTTVTPIFTVTPSRTPTATPTSFTPPPVTAETVLDFANICQASWTSDAGMLPCPGTDGDARGFVLPVSNPKLEDGTLDTAPGLIVFPQNKYDGYIQGTYPEITIQPGDRFQGIVNCAYGSSCYVTFRLDYQVGTGPVTTFWTWKEKNEGKYYRFDKDLSSLTGKNVKFILTILSTGPTTGDRALWGQPRIFRTGYVTPTPMPTTPSP